MFGCVALCVYYERQRQRQLEREREREEERKQNKNATFSLCVYVCMNEMDEPHYGNHNFMPQE